MKIFFMFATCLCIAMTTTAYATDGRDSAAWWLKSYGGVTAKDEPLVGRAERIFERVAAAADKNGKRFPRLVVINYAYDPYAASIQDGSIILTLGGLKLCYRGVKDSPRVGRIKEVICRLSELCLLRIDIIYILLHNDSK